jgi:hypothetical protein
VLIAIHPPRSMHTHPYPDDVGSEKVERQ